MEEKSAQFPEGSAWANLPDEVLEGIAGGQFNEGQTMWLDSMISMYKSAGKTIEDIIAYNHRLQPSPPRCPRLCRCRNGRIR